MLVSIGPANLALAIALREMQESANESLRFCFVERQPGFAWHTSLLLPGSQLQVSPLKDLVSMRDPTSSYSFVNYLHQRGRLAAFINREANIPSRREWSAYLTWAAKRMSDYVTYSQDVVSVETVQNEEKRENNNNSEGGMARLLRVTTRDVETGRIYVRLARNITVGVGGMPHVPESFRGLYQSGFDAAAPGNKKGSAHVVHSSSYLPSLAKLEPLLRRRESRRLADLSSAAIASFSFSPTTRRHEKNSAPLRLAVVGSGQSAAEMTLHLRKTFPMAHVSLIFRATAIAPSDDSPFVNAMAFDPERTDAFWSASETDRKEWLAEFKRTNYSVVRSDVLNELHTALYDQNIELDEPWPHADGPPSHGQLRLVPNTHIQHVEAVAAPDDAAETSLALTLADLKSVDDVRHSGVEVYDAVFLGTGFVRSPKAMPFLQSLQPLYPLLDSRAAERVVALGFGEEVDRPDAIARFLASEASDEAASDRLRERTRGITRDYRLVSYTSDAFAAHPVQQRRGSARFGLAGEGRGGAGVSRDSSPRQELAAQQHGHSGVQVNGAAAVAVDNEGSAASSVMTSGANSPRRGSDTGLSSGCSSSTLADEAGHAHRSGAPSRAATTPQLMSAIARGASAEPSIYFMGGNEATHGLSDSLLSIVAHRAGELCTSILERRRLAKASSGAAATAHPAANPASALHVAGSDTHWDRATTTQQPDAIALNGNGNNASPIDALQDKLRNMRTV